MNTTTNTKCGKCDGRGIIRAFAHIDSGKCFQCGGSGACEPGRGSTVGPATVWTRGSWISFMNESINSMKNARSQGWDWHAEESDGHSYPKAFAWKLANCPHADIVARALVAARRLGFAR